MSMTTASGRRFCCALATAALVAAVPEAGAAEVTVQNDSLTTGSTGLVQGGFDPGEWAASWLTAPVDGTIVAVQVGWFSVAGGQPDQIEDRIQIWTGGTYPAPGTPLETLFSPLLTDGVINEYRFVDALQTIPLSIPVTMGQEIVVGFQFLNDPQGLPVGGPSVVTDADGCQSGKNAVFCLSGCAGWNNPCIFPISFSGDFLIRMVIETGGPPTGACCLADGTCLENQTASDCTTQGGTYQNDGTTCAGVSCPLPLGACCLDATSCLDDQSETACTVGGGTWMGANSVCDDTNMNGAPDVCEPPQGACCFGASCSVLTSTDCGIAGGAYQGDGTDCSDLNGTPGADICEPPEGSCCFGLSCSDLTEADCMTAGGTYLGDGTNCVANPCPDPVGACCLANGACITEVQTDCENIPGAVWQGDGTDCTDGNMNGTADDCEPPCVEDCAAGGNGTVDISDLLQVLGEWGQAGPECDFASPAGTVDINELLAVLAAWGPC